MSVGAVAYFAAEAPQAEGLWQGYAAPAGGFAACRLEAWNGGRLMAAVDATTFAPEALPLREGWCGFSLEIDASLFVFDDRLDLLCAASDRKLATFGCDILNMEAAPNSKHDQLVASVESLMAPDDRRPSVEGVARLLVRLASVMTVEHAAESLYVWLLRRSGDPGGLAHKIALLGNLATARIVVEDVLNGEEYQALPRHLRLLTPFDYGAPAELLEALAAARTP
jgi:hypothetical protein